MKSRRGNPVLPLGKTNAAGVVTDLSAIISGSLKLLTNLVVTTISGVGEKSAIFNFTCGS